MELVKIGRKGQLTIPKSVLKAVGIEAEAKLLVDAEPDGSIRLRPAAVYPIERYSDERIAEFERENEASTEVLERVDRLLKSRQR
jgi:AbrB family looped-hinge helix DNA binding protein